MGKRLRSWALTLALAAALVGVGFLGLRRWTPVCVTGGSMSPTLHAGDIALVDRRGPLTVGSVALLATERHGRFLHRVIGIGLDGFVRTQGDANAAADLDAVPKTNVVGPVVLVVPVGRLLSR